MGDVEKIAVAILIIAVLGSCSLQVDKWNKQAYEEGYSVGYEEGAAHGYEEGYDDGYYVALSDYGIEP